MKTERIYLQKDNTDAYLDCYLADEIPGYTRAAILVIPGGGYWNICSDREGEPIALGFLPHGFQAFVLHYSTAGKRVFPAQLIEAALAMRHIRAHAAEYGLDPYRVFVTGFSAGGHLAGSLGILWDLPEVISTLGGGAEEWRPDGMMLCYPVVNDHAGSFCNLLGTPTPTEEQLSRVFLDRHVNERAVPLFLVHTASDPVVPVHNALDLAASYARAGKLFELHVYPDAPHGFALGNAITAGNEPKHDDPALARWIADAARWAESL